VARADAGSLTVRPDLAIEGRHVQGLLQLTLEGTGDTAKTFVGEMGSATSCHQLQRNNTSSHSGGNPNVKESCMSVLSQESQHITPPDESIAISDCHFSNTWRRLTHLIPKLESIIRLGVRAPNSLMADHFRESHCKRDTLCYRVLRSMTPGKAVTAQRA